jgi:hypothetical protein
MNETVDEESNRELFKLICKLRWIGENEEADRLQGKLRLARPRDCKPAVHSDTD